MGVCGAAVGVGIAFSLLLEANPLKADERQTVQRVTCSVLQAIVDLKAARCCQRDSWIALTKAAELFKDMLPLALKAEQIMICTQYARNRECLGKACPLHPENTSRLG